MITIRCICTDKAQMRILRFSYLYYRRNPVASGEWFDSIPHFFVQKMHRLLSCLKYQGKVLQEEREDKMSIPRDYEKKSVNKILLWYARVASLKIRLLTLVLLLGQSPVCHCGVFRWSEKRSFGKQINHLLCRWVSIASAYRKNLRWYN